MLRFLCALFKIPYEPCKSCEVLKQQLDLANAYNKELTSTLLGMVKPEIVESAPVILAPMASRGGLWSKRREALESADRMKARTLRDSPFVAVPDKVSASGLKDKIINREAIRDDNDIASLETELKIAEGES